MGQLDSRVFVVGIEVHLIAHLAQDTGQIPGRLAAQNGQINVLTQDVIPGGFSGFLGQVEITGTRWASFLSTTESPCSRQRVSEASCRAR